MALVGTSGSGKSTIFGLIEKFYDLSVIGSGGFIKIGSRHIEDISTTELRRSIGLVQQEAPLFNRSIRENISYGLCSSSQVDIEEAAKKANIHDWIINQLPQGYDTIVGPRGSLVSGGQRQRIVLARCFLADPPILLLDEATSALDSESETAIQASLLKLAENRSCIMIAHRLSTVQHAHRIYVLSKGLVVEEGSHDELVSLKGGLYAELVSKQNLY